MPDKSIQYTEIFTNDKKSLASLSTTARRALLESKRKSTLWSVRKSLGETAALCMVYVNRAVISRVCAMSSATPGTEAQTKHVNHRYKTAPNLKQRVS